MPAESFGAALQYFTGSKEHNIVLRGRAKERGLKINEYGVFRGEKQIAGRTEEEVYAHAGPALFSARAARGPARVRVGRRRRSCPSCRAGRHPRRPAHAQHVDRRHWRRIEEMAAAAKQRGLKYIAITDHSKRVTMVGGLDAERLRQQWAEIDELNERLNGITVLKGVEVDILERGGLDLPDDVLAEADWVVASVHYGQKQSREQITRRVIEALENPHVCGDRPSDGPDAAGAQAVRDRPGRGDEGRPRPRQDAGTQRPSRRGSTWTTWPVRRRRATAFRSSFRPTPIAPRASTRCVAACSKPAAAG